MVSKYDNFINSTTLISSGCVAANFPTGYPVGHFPVGYPAGPAEFCFRFKLQALI